MYIWDYATPTLLSFGFGSCDGKSTLLNQLFRSTFEQKNEKSVYFHKTIDIDFGYNFITKRPLNIADMHGNVSNGLPRNVLSLFDGIIGPQNSGKSTLLNYMFGTLFDVRNGRCTRGVYGSFVKSNIPSFDYIMLLDTEGLLGTEKGDLEYDRRLILFCLAVSHLVIVNIAGDLNQAVKDMIILCVDSLKEINVNKMPTPILHFILNQRPDTNLANNRKVIKNIVDQLHTDKPDKTIAISVEQFHSLPSAFKVENILNNPKLPKLQITSNDFLEETTQLTKVLVQSATVNCQRFTDQKGHSDRYIDPLKWIQNAFTIFDVLQRFPDLTHFKDLKEKKLDKQIRNGIRKLLETKLSSTEKQKSLDGCSGKTRSQIDEIFQISFDVIYKECEKRLQTIFEELGPSATIRERSAQFLKTQVYEARNAWRDAAYRAHDENELNLLVRNGEQDLRNLINKTIKEAAENGTDLTEEKARKIFNDMYKKKMKSIQEQFNAKECLPTLQIILHCLPIIERISNDYSPNSLMHTDANSTDDEVEIDGQKERRPIPFNDAIEIIRKELSSINPERNSLLNNFIMKTVHGATRDTECAKDLTNALLETIKEQFKTKAHLLIEKIIQENYAKLNRAFLLDLCDQKVNRITDKVWVRKYVEKPRIVMEEEFVNDWNRTEQAINNKIIEEKLSQQQILSKFFTLIQDISGKIQQTSLGDDIHFISDALQSFGGDAEQNRINKGQGCSEDCECCGRPCDVDHTLSATPIGKDDNCHRCDKGHQYRAFKGFKYETDSTKPEDKYEPSLITCEDVEENQTIRHERSGFEGSWCEFKKRFPAWYFGDNAIDKKSASTEQARNRYDKIWRLIGPDLCAENKWKYVVINSKPKIDGVDTTPKHFFFLVDGSGSMGNNTEASRWGSLKKSVLKFVQIRQMYTADRITIISFADKASITCDNEQIKNVKDLTRIDGGTSFPNVIEKLNEALNDMKEKGSSLNNVIAFMSDGKDIYPQKQLEELKAKHDSTIKSWFTIAAATDKRILTQINDAMKGTLIDVTEDMNIEGGLMKAFVEIAN
ncbi:unnamed protein product, partial [Rotaria sordida]